MATNSTFFNPAGVELDGHGGIFVADVLNDAIRYISDAGVVSALAGQPGQSGDLDGAASSAQFSNPWGLALDSQGNLYVADTDNEVIQVVTDAGTVVRTPHRDPKEPRLLQRFGDVRALLGPAGHRAQSSEQPVCVRQQQQRRPQDFQRRRFHGGR